MRAVPRRRIPRCADADLRQLFFPRLAAALARGEFAGSMGQRRTQVAGTLIKVAGLSALFVAAAHAQTQAERQAAAPAAVQSARAQLHVTLDFAPHMSSETPLLRIEPYRRVLSDFVQRIRVCEAAGVELRSITVIVSLDRNQRPHLARAEARRRQGHIRAALVSAGAPGDKIVMEPTVEMSGMMRARITANFTDPCPR